jgi:hypothetical protein
MTRKTDDALLLSRAAAFALLPSIGIWRFRAFEYIRQFLFLFCQAEVTNRRAVNVREFPSF